MNPVRLLVVLLIAFVVLSGLNYFYDYERTEALNAQLLWEAMHSVVTNPLGVIVTSEFILQQQGREFRGMVYREVVLMVLGIIGIVLLARRRQSWNT